MQLFQVGRKTLPAKWLLILKPYGLAAPGDGAEAIQLSESLP